MVRWQDLTLLRVGGGGPNRPPLKAVKKLLWPNQISNVLQFCFTLLNWVVFLIFPKENVTKIFLFKAQYNFGPTPLSGGDPGKGYLKANNADVIHDAGLGGHTR